MNFLDSRLSSGFWDRCIPEPNTGCWLWLGRMAGGYGCFLIGSRTDGSRRSARAHRVAYEALVGPVPPGLELDHRRCSTPSCVNPQHLEAVTHQVNVLRGRSPAAHFASVTHCPRGHAYDVNNTRYAARANGRQARVCRQCENANRRAQRAGRTR